MGDVQGDATSVLNVFHRGKCVASRARIMIELGKGTHALCHVVTVIFI
jgi:hypothetical protein